MELRELTQISAVSGNERSLQKRIRAVVEPLCDDLRSDGLGNLIAVKGKGKPGPTVMVSAHLDEVGLIVSGIHKSGLLHFQKVGTVAESALLGKHVLVGEKQVPGVIGAKPLHLLEAEERSQIPKCRALFIDIGARDRAAAQSMVGVGDYVAFATHYSEFGNGLVKAKALESRSGCYVLLKLLAGEISCPLYAVFTTQKEIGLRGARVAAYAVAPDMALVLDGAKCSCVPGHPEHQVGASLGQGPVIGFAGRSAMASRPLAGWLAGVAKDDGIPFQWLALDGQDSDAGTIELARDGVRTTTIGIPCRYMGSPTCVAALSDIEQALQLLQAAFRALPAAGSGP